MGSLTKKREMNLKAVTKYQQSEKGKAVIKKYCQSARYKKYQRMYRSTLLWRLRQVYANLKYRCNNPDNPGFKNYGKRGIKNKFNSFDGFRDYIISALRYDTYEKIKGLEIDRIDNNGNYEKGNIRFVTRSENCYNRKR